MKTFLTALLLITASACVGSTDNAAGPAPDAGADNILDPKGRGCDTGTCLLAPDAGEDDIRMGREKPIEGGPIGSDPAPPKPPAVDAGAAPPKPSFVGGKGGETLPPD